MKRSKADRAKLTLLYIAIARRDGGWKCTYCGDPLAPIGDLRAFKHHPGRHHDVCPDGDHDDAYGPCWHGPYLTTLPGYEQAAADHVIPKSRGGIDDISNRVLACYPCNGRKGAKLLSELPPNWWERKTYSPYWVAGKVLPA